MKLTASTLGVLCLVLAGCNSTSAKVIHEYPPRPSDHVVEVYLSESAPIEARDYGAGTHEARDLPAGAEEIGVLDVFAEGILSLDGMILNARERARVMGGDIVLLESVNIAARGGVTWFGGGRTVRFRVYRLDE